MDSDTVVVMTGDPASGFRLIGPVRTNTEEAEFITDVVLRGAYWWYVPIESAESATRRHRAIIGAR